MTDARYWLLKPPLPTFTLYDLYDRPNSAEKEAMLVEFNKILIARMLYDKWTSIRIRQEREAEWFDKLAKGMTSSSIYWWLNADRCSNKEVEQTKPNTTHMTCDEISDEVPMSNPFALEGDDVEDYIWFASGRRFRESATREKRRSRVNIHQERDTAD